MSHNNVEQKPSETALFAALRRTIANKEYKNRKFGPDDLAEYFLPPHFRFFLKFETIRANTKDKLNKFLPGLNEYQNGLFRQAICGGSKQQNSSNCTAWRGVRFKGVSFCEVDSWYEDI